MPDSISMILQVPAEPKPGHDPFLVRPRPGMVLICVDQRKEELSWGLYIPMETNHEKLHEGSGRIVRTNPIDDKKIQALDLHAGDRVMYRGYLRHANKLEVQEFCQKHTDGSEKVWCFIDINDLVMQLDGDVEVGLLSEKK